MAINQIRSRSHRRRLFGGTYTAKVLSYGPIAYWPLNEPSGSVARCQVNPAQNGAAVGVTWANDTTGTFRTPAPYFDGVNDYINIFSATLAAAFSGAVGSAMLWMKVANVGVWTDTTVRHAFLVGADANNRHRMYRSNANNTMTGRGTAGAGNCTIDKTAVADTGWLPVAITWSDGANADQFLYYYDAVAVAAACTSLNNWAGAPAEAWIGAYSGSPPQYLWQGWLSHCALWDRVLTQAEITALANP